MSVLLNIAMPKTCEVCPCNDDNWRCGATREYFDYDDMCERRRADCPLISIPTPHGRLIDADEFERDFNEHLLPILIKKYGEDEALKGLHFSFRDCICNIQCQKTVIEAERDALKARVAELEAKRSEE